MPKKPTGKKKKPAALVAGTSGCCTIQYDDKPEDQIPGITQAKCNQIARQRGGTAQWTPGACAE